MYLEKFKILGIIVTIVVVVTLVALVAATHIALVLASQGYLSGVLKLTVVQTPQLKIFSPKIRLIKKFS